MRSFWQKNGNCEQAYIYCMYTVCIYIDLWARNSKNCYNRLPYFEEGFRSFNGHFPNRRQRQTRSPDITRLNYEAVLRTVAPFERNGSISAFRGRFLIKMGSILTYTRRIDKTSRS